MASLANILTYWAANSTLNNAIPSSSVYTGLIPPSLIGQYPYVALSVVSSVPKLTTGKGYIEDFHFQISIYHQSLNTLEGLTDTVDGQFNKQTITASGMACQRLNRMTITEAQAELTTYHNILEYTFTFNATLP